MTKFSTDFKLNVVTFYLENNVSKQEIAKQFGVIKSEVIKWIALFEHHGVDYDLDIQIIHKSLK